MLKEFQDVFSDSPGSTHLVKHKLSLTTDEPVRSKPYPLPYAVREALKDEIDLMLQLGVIEKCNSSYSSNVVMVKKKDSSNRVCVDFRKLNRITVFDVESMPSVEDIFAKLHGDSVFSKLYFSKAYCQIPLEESSRPRTAFVTPYGCYQFSKMPFGLVNATASFNRLIRKLLEDLSNIDGYVDDVLTHTKSWEDHMTVLRKFLLRVSSANLTVKPSKCYIGLTDLSFLGHKIADKVIQPHPDKVGEILEAPRPQTKKQVRSFLGLVGYFRRFVPNFAAVAVPLTDLTRKGLPNHVNWEDSHEQAFVTLKSMLTKEPVLRMPDFSKPFWLQTDASDVGVGAALLQEYEDGKFPVAYASKKLRSRERACSVVEQKCLALVWAIKRFQTYLYGKEFVLETDHQPLTYINQCKVNNCKIMRWARVSTELQI